MVVAEPGVVLEDLVTGFCGAVVACGRREVTLEDRHGHRRVLPLPDSALALEGQLVRVQVPGPPPPASPTVRTRSGSLPPPPARAQVARGGRLWVEGRHDAELVEKVWGEDLRAEAVVVEPLDGIDHLPARLAAFNPGPGRRLGVLVDHLVAGSKESRLLAEVRHPHVLVTGHPYVDIWQAVRPAALGLAAWPVVPRGRPWKEGVAAALGAADPARLWPRILRSVRDWTDLEVGLLRAVEELVDFVTGG